MERNHAALQKDFASCQGELAARCDDLDVLRDAHAAAEAQVTQQSQDIQVSPCPHQAIHSCLQNDRIARALSPANNVDSC